MKKCIAFLILSALLFSLCACTAQEPEPATTAPGITVNWPQINQKLTWDAINAFPVKSEDMTVDQMRQLCVDFFYFSKTALWIPDTNWNYTIASSGNSDQMFMGQIYGGLPYITNGGGNVYRLMDYIDEATGVVDMTVPIQEPTLFGNQCSYGSYWGWARVINSAEFAATSNMTHSKGFLRVGPYTYDDSRLRFEEGGWDTKTIIQENGPEIMCQSYALTKLGDGLVLGGEGGHVMMIKTDPVVVYAADGTIDAAQSYLYILDQHGAWTEDTNEAGDTFTHKNYLNRKFTFNDLMAQGYIPFTFAEFLGTDPVEPTQCTFSHTGDTIRISQLNEGIVTANYALSDIYAQLKDKDGNVILSIPSRQNKPTMTLNFNRLIKSDEWSAYTTGEYTVEVVCQLGTGERLTVYTGTLVK